MANIIVSLIEPVIEVGKLLIPPFLSNLGYFIHFKRNIGDLREQMGQLETLRADVQRAVDVARSNGQTIKGTVTDWLDRVEAMESEVEAMKSKVAAMGSDVEAMESEVTRLTASSNAIEENIGCLQGGYRARYHVGKEAKRMADAVEKLLGECKSNDVSIPPGPPPDMETIPMLDFQAYEPTKLAMDQITEALVDNKFKMVGVYGMGGVGKTTLVTQLAKELKKEGIFDRVVMVTVSQNLILKKIQGDIAENLGFEIKEDNESVRSRRLLERMKQEKRIIIIFDDLWRHLNLFEEVGIPYGVDGGGGGCNCSILITTRSLEVCNQMQTECNVEVKHLPKGDAWQLFKRSAGDLVDSSREMHDVANEVVEACDGLPVALVTVGRALRDKDLEIWRDAANQLKNSIASIVPEGISERVVSCIKLSYDHLRSKETKLCFLLCCSFPEDFVIYEDHLFPYVWGEKVFKSINTLKEAGNRLHTVLDALKRSCLLLSVDDTREPCVRMHDIIRAVAILIASEEEHGFVVEAGKGLKAWPVMEDHQVKCCKRLSLMNNDIRKLPDRINCPQLVSLSLQDNEELDEIPDGCFEGMISLKVLDLSPASIRSLPSSLPCLMELRVLYIKRHFWSQNKNMLDVSILGKMNKLEILTIRGCITGTLPLELRGLTNLKSLNLSYNDGLIIPPNLLSKLSCLEELNLLRSFNDWQPQRSEDTEKACLSEVASLASLTKLGLGISNTQCLDDFDSIPWKNLTEFSIVLGTSIYPAGVLAYETRKMVIQGETNFIPSNWPWVEELLIRQTEELELKIHHSPKNISPGLIGGSHFNNLRSLVIYENKDLEHIIVSDEVEEVPTIAFQRLEQLQLDSLKKLRNIFHGNIILPNLRGLYIRACNSLEHIFQLSMAQGLPQLEEIMIVNCRALEEVFHKNDEENDGKVVLPRLRVLELYNLPNFSMLCRGLSCPDFPAIESLYVENCPSLKKFPINPSSVGTPRLKEIKAEETWFNNLEWDVPTDKPLLQERVKW